jgi:hypothetical protein
MSLAVGFGRSGCDRVRFSLRPSHRGQSAEQTASSALTAKRVVLSGHRPAWATVQNDEGALAGDDSLRQLSIVLKRSAQRQASFERLRCDQQDPDSVDYHHLWPMTTIDTAAIRNILPEMAQTSRNPSIMADAAHAILTKSSRDVTGQFFIDEEVLRAGGVVDFSGYAIHPGAKLTIDFFIPDDVVDRFQRSTVSLD